MNHSSKDDGTKERKRSVDRPHIPRKRGEHQQERKGSDHEEGEKAVAT